ncbi:MAG: hydrogenase maturation protease, partial [Candidatus Omnitrophota bacterium]
LFGGTAPENMTGEIKRIKPEYLVIIDAAEMGLTAGEIDVIDVERIGGISFSTHSLPLAVLADYIRPSVSGEIFVVGIQPKSLAFGGSVCEEVKAAAALVARIFQETISP